MATVCLEQVSKHYASHRILDGVSLTVEKGEFMVVVGPSGCGKSTLLRLVAGLEQLSAGKILINERCVNEIPPAKRDMAMVFQSYALYPHMSVFDNMAYALKIRKVPKKEIQQRVQQAAQLLQIEAFLSRKPSDLSGGQRQRVAMGRAMVRSPAVFLFDEPLSNLDAKLRSEMRMEIKKLHQKLQTTFLYVTHDQTEAMTMADRILILNQGKIEQIGPPATLYAQPASLFVAGFIGHYPLNECDAILEEGGRGLRFNSGSRVRLTACYGQDGERVRVAIRPEHLAIATPDEQHFAASIDFVEDMGSDKLLRLHCDGWSSSVLLRVEADTLLPEQRFAIKLPPEKIHLFDPVTGRRLVGKA
ncbi:MAG: sn-glycerol-3-phosphate ABC transporter ATP-binding protein UgpC [Legionellaceae bacterium]|nr:sn-glycerol-3-phosphate ABC transporter ATP-binding protein UgpC [Legionellaceae bacterium]